MCAQGRFTVLPVGVEGGFDDSDLSGYLLSSSKSFSDSAQPFISLDAGTIMKGLLVAREKGYLAPLVPTGVSYASMPGSFLTHQIKAYFLSHAHLDHTKGFVINAVEDSNGKGVYGINITITRIADFMFNGQIWPNFGPTGLNKYTYFTMQDGVEVSIPGTGLTVEAYHLRHSYPYLSTAFLIKNELGEYVLYFGDVGPDSVENGRSSPNDLNTNLLVWKRVASLIQLNKLLAIFLECSYADPKDPGFLFGHLSPKYFFEEIGVLEKQVKDLISVDKPLTGLNVVVTHIKPLVDGSDIKSVIQKQLQNVTSTYGVHLIYPEQGVPFQFVSYGNYQILSSVPNGAGPLCMSLFLLVLSLLKLVII
eukprot:TRINITY_DN18201_c0_g1_i1.p1 TRINITY_DN18201_c0_g1~~TRINITY_DN18201_c0_g1_i1.p1  ORF type:complete len:383 (-),score=41.54 TRINITY_DN18201_c0_g1_i1:7-1098(-)